MTTKLRQTAELRPERIQLRAMASRRSELRPERIQLQARLDALATDSAWQVSEDGRSLVGIFGRPPKAELADLICLLTDTAPRFGVSPTVSFEGNAAQVSFFGDEGELSRRAIGFAALVDDLFPAIGAGASDLPVDDGGPAGEPEVEPTDGPVVEAPTEPEGDVIATA